MRKRSTHSNSPLTSVSSAPLRFNPYEFPTGRDHLLRGPEPSDGPPEGVAPVRPRTARCKGWRGWSARRRAGRGRGRDRPGFARFARRRRDRPRPARRPWSAPGARGRLSGLAAMASNSPMRPGPTPRFCVRAGSENWPTRSARTTSPSPKSMATCTRSRRSIGGGSSLPAVETLLADGQRRVASLADRLKTIRLGAETMNAVNPDLATLRNLNTPEDYRRAFLDAGFEPDR